MKKLIILALVIAVACGSVQDISQLKHAAIVAGCEASESNAGAAGDLSEVITGCEAALRMWEKK
jgi:hypothetical protein